MCLLETTDSLRLLSLAVLHELLHRQKNKLSSDLVMYCMGFYLEEGIPDRIGLNVLTISSYTSETVWYASIASLNSIGCPISVGSSGMLNTLLQGAPVVSIETGK